MPGQSLLDIDESGVLQHHGQGTMPQEQPQRVQVTASLEIPGGEIVTEAMGAAAACSFYPGKNLGACGEAGATKLMT